MSKYYKAEDIVNMIINIAPDGEVFELGMSALQSLPTIVSEDCISRGKLISELEGIWEGSTPNIPRTMIDFQNMLEEIDYQIRNAPRVVPTTEQSSKVGEWKITNTYKDHSGRVVDRIEHTDCGYIWNREMGEPLHNYCPNCGAKMKAADNER